MSDDDTMPPEVLAILARAAYVNDEITRDEYLGIVRDLPVT